MRYSGSGGRIPSCCPGSLGLGVRGLKLPVIGCAEDVAWRDGRGLGDLERSADADGGIKDYILQGPVMGMQERPRDFGAKAPPEVAYQGPPKVACSVVLLQQAGVTYTAMIW